MTEPAFFFIGELRTIAQKYAQRVEGHLYHLEKGGGGWWSKTRLTINPDGKIQKMPNLLSRPQIITKAEAEQIEAARVVVTDEEIKGNDYCLESEVPNDERW